MEHSTYAMNIQQNPQGSSQNTEDSASDMNNHEAQQNLENSAQNEEDTHCAGNGKTECVTSGVSSPVPLTLIDRKVLECYICFETFRPPVYQCQNGHPACSHCVSRIKNKCPSCSKPIGAIRNIALEKILESLKVSCQYEAYGCIKSFTYGTRTKKEHEKSCDRAPFYCPIQNCHFIGPSAHLLVHFADHSVDDLEFGRLKSMVLKRNDEFLVLQDSGASLFIANNFPEANGQAITVSCMALSEVDCEYHYELQATNNESKVKFESKMESVRNRVEELSASESFLLIPHCFFTGSDQKVDLKLRVKKVSVSSTPRKRCRTAS